MNAKIIIVLLLLPISVHCQKIEKYLDSGFMYLAMDSISKAEENFNQVLVIEYDNIDALLGTAIVNVKKGFFCSANNILLKVIKETNDVHILSKSYQVLGDIALLKHKKNNALKKYKKALNLNAEAYSVYLSIANLYYSINKYNRAISLIKESLVIKNENPLAYALLGEIYLYMDEYYLAESSFNKLLKLDSLNSLAYFQRGKCRYYLDKESLEDFNKVNIQTLENDYKGEYYFLVGCVYYDNHMYSKSIEKSLKAIHYVTDEMDLYLSLGDAFFEKKNYYEAISYYQSYLSFKPVNNIVYNKLGFSYAKINDIKNSEKYLIKAHRKLKNNYLTHSYMGFLYFKKGDLTKALKFTNESLKLLERQNKINYAGYSYYLKSIILFKQKKYGEGFENLELAKEKGYNKEEIEKLNSTYCKYINN